MRMHGAAFLRTYQRFLGRLFTPTPRDLELATIIDRYCTTQGVTHERLMAYWRRRADDFYPSAFPALEILANPGAVIEAANAEPPVRSEPHKEGRALDPRLRRHLGVDRSEWSDEHLLMLQRTVLARLDGEQLFVPERLFALAARAAELFTPIQLPRTATPKTA